MASSIGKVDIPEDLLCPVCFELPDTEVYQCRDGHLLCSTCYFKLTHCPQCRDPLDSDRPIRCRPIERVLEGFQISCAFKSNGCNKRLQKGSAKDHELGCCYDIKKFGEFVSICKNIGYPECQFKFNGASIKEAVEHFRAEHGCIPTNSETFKMELTSFKENGKVGRNGFQSWIPILVDLKKWKCILLTMAILNKKDGAFGISSFFVRYLANEKLLQSPIQLEYTILSGDVLDETLTSFTQTPLDAVKAVNFIPNNVKFNFYAPFYTTRCNVEGSLIIELSVKRNGVDKPLVRESNDTLVCLSKSIIQSYESIDTRDMSSAALQLAKKLDRDCTSSRSNVGPAIREIFSLNCLKYYALYMGAKYGDVETFQYLIEKEININILYQPAGVSPLIVTMFDCKPEIGLEKAKLLVKHGADIHTLTGNNCSLLHYAAQFSDQKAVSYFLQLGLDINVVDKLGDTPLHCAGLNKAFGAEVAQLLLDFGADPNIQNAKEQTPLEVAIQNKNLKVKDVLALHLANQ